MLEELINYKQIISSIDANRFHECANKRPLKLETEILHRGREEQNLLSVMILRG